MQKAHLGKLHLGIDALTSEIVAQTLTCASQDDASQVQSLLSQPNRQIASCKGDGAYDRWRVHVCWPIPPSGQPTPIDAVIPPREDAALRKAKRKYRHIKARNQCVLDIWRKGRKRWKRESGYHQRSLAETGISRFKRIFGPHLRARTLDGQQVEARLACGMLNKMTLLGMPKTYTVEMDA